MINIEVFTSPGCGKCGKAIDVLKQVVRETGDEYFHWRAVDILKEMDYAIELGVLTTPAIAIDGKLEFSGLPSPGKLKHVLHEYIPGKS